MAINRFRFPLLACLVSGTISACALPAAAPTASDIEIRHDATQEFYLVGVNGRVLPYLTQTKGRAFPFASRGFGYQPNVRLRPGDVVTLTIYESGGSSLFNGSTGAAPGGAQSSQTPLPAQVVERDGHILVPFVGAVDVAGKTPIEAAHIIEQGLSSQTVRPQVIVSLAANGSNTATVLGDINKPGPFPLSLRGERLLDAIAFSGGERYPISETDIRLIRGRVGATVSLQQVIDHPNQNVRVQPDDQIIAIHNPKTFTVLGASAKVAQYNFDTPTVTLAEAVARSGGFIDTVGNPGGIYLFRREPTATARAVIAVADQGGAAPLAKPHVLTGPTTPILYRIDLNTSDGYFLAQKIQIADGDIVLVANSEGTQLVKLLTIIRGITGIAYDLTSTGTK